MGYVRHTYDSPSPNEEHEVVIEEEDVVGLKEAKEDTEALNVFLQL